MILYFLRHASAGQSKNDPEKDARRPLDREGQRQCLQVGRALAALDVRADVIVSSPLKRSTQTAALVGNEIGFDGKIHIEKGLLPNASFPEFQGMLDRYANHDEVILVGHGPSLPEFLGRMITVKNSLARFDLKKCAVARVEVENRVASVLWVLTPRVVRALHDSSAESRHPKTSRK